MTKAARGVILCRKAGDVVPVADHEVKALTVPPATRVLVARSVRVQSAVPRRV
jgi:hypothetical protein